MPKIKPILIFIIASVGLHWWVLSLPIFKRIQVLEGNSVKSSSPTFIAYLGQVKPLIQTPEKPELQTPTNSNTEESNSLRQQIVPPSFFRGSPWSRRSIENQNFSTPIPLQSNPLTQVENSIADDPSIGESDLIECKRNIASSPFNCQSLKNKVLSEKLANAINKKVLESNIPVPNCITLEVLQKKWHAKACHS